MIYLLVLSCLIVGIIFIHKHFKGTQCTIKKNLKGYHVFITGCNTGIGKETAIELAKMGALIIMACRDYKKTQQVADKIKKLGLIQPIILNLDLSDLRSVEKCVADLNKSSIHKIDILINNAGIMALPQRSYTKQGFEMQFGVNHLGHFHLTNLLIPLLKRAGKSRIINLSSMGHKMNGVQFSDINFDQYANSIWWQHYYTWKAYAQSKSANILHAFQLNQNYEMDGIKAYSVHPGVVRTDLGRHLSKVLQFGVMIFYGIYSLFTKNALEGAQTSIYCAIQESDQLYGGGYYSDCYLTKTSENDPIKAQRLWNISEEMIKSTRD